MKKVFLITLCLILTIVCSFAQTSKTKKKKSTKTKKTTRTSTVQPTTTAPTKTASIVDLAPSLNSLTDVDISKGLKEALTIGANSASALLSQPNGYYGNPEVKIPFPQEIEKVSSELRLLGLGQQVDNFEKTMNQAAEKAAVEAAPIFVHAITDMSITDAKNILTSSTNSAATGYLQSKCTSQLTTAFTPHIKTALDNSLATAYWKQITTYYNKLPFVTPVTTDLVQYTTSKALQGLFKMVGQEEAKIRSDSATWTTNVLKNVFGAK